MNACLSRSTSTPKVMLATLAAIISGSVAAGAQIAPPVAITAELAQTTLLAGTGQRTYLRVAVKPARRAGHQRAPMNVALVIDRSGSMSSYGRIENARLAAQMAVDRLGPDDILSVVSYDNRVDVEVPAGKVEDRGRIKARIERLSPRGSTAIHAGLLAGASEVRKFKSSDRVNRIVLISDGLANVGPSRPQDFVDLGRELASEGITVSTIGLGNDYNEDLMAGLARAADGGHVFVQESAELAGFLAREFDDAQGIVGQEVEIIIRLRDGVKPLRSLGRAAQAETRKISYKVGALVGGVEQVLVDEIEVSEALAANAGEARIADVTVNYKDVASGQRHSETRDVSVRFDADKDRAGQSVNAAVMRDVTALVSRAERRIAVELRDKGRFEEARAKFKANAEYVRQQQSKLQARDYAPLADELKASEAAAAPAAQSSDGWLKARKVQRATDSNNFGASTKY